jgi:hypothetical protein
MEFRVIAQPNYNNYNLCVRRQNSWEGGKDNIRAIWPAHAITLYTRNRRHSTVCPALPFGERRQII